MRKLIICTALFISFASSAHAVEKAERISDREIIESLAELKAGQKGLEQRMGSLETSLNKRMDSLETSIDKRMDRLENRMERIEDVMMWGFGLLFTSMIGLVGFVLWDRRTTVAPVARALKDRETEFEELKRKERAMEDLLRDYAAGDQRLAGLMKARGLM